MSSTSQQKDLFDRIGRESKIRDRLARVFSSVGRATALQAVGRRFKPCNTHQSCATKIIGAVVQMVRILACHARGRGFDPRPLRHFTGLH